MYKKAYVGGTFDLPHYGHYRLFKRIKEIANELVVSLNTDDFVMQYKQRDTYLSLAERIETLSACKYIDSIVVNVGGYDSKIAIDVVRPDCIVHGDDWTGDEYLKQLNIDKEYLKKNNIELVYFPYTKEISTTKILNFKL
jgi:glycerol-3-phosphate cytidylyltransferase